MIIDERYEETKEHMEALNKRIKRWKAEEGEEGYYSLKDSLLEVLAYNEGGTDTKPKWNPILGSPYRLGSLASKLDSMPAQEVLDTVATHLLLQNAKSTKSPGSCSYNGPEGLCCAAAIFIEDYVPEHEGITWGDVAHTEAHIYLISDLQYLHDEFAVRSWPQRLRNLALEQGLQIPRIVKEKLLANTTES